MTTTQPSANQRFEIYGPHWGTDIEKDRNFFEHRNVQPTALIEVIYTRLMDKGIFIFNSRFVGDEVVDGRKNVEFMMSFQNRRFESPNWKTTTAYSFCVVPSDDFLGMKKPECASQPLELIHMNITSIETFTNWFNYVFAIVDLMAFDKTKGALVRRGTASSAILEDKLFNDRPWFKPRIHDCCVCMEPTMNETDCDHPHPLCMSCYINLDRDEGRIHCPMCRNVLIDGLDED